MFYLKTTFKYIFITSIFISSFAIRSATSFASMTSGSIDSVYHSALLCTSGSCATTTQINWKPDQGTPVIITDTEVTGNAWSETFGWINFNPIYEGVKNTPEGILSGYAWSDGAGWINFKPDFGGVIINISGQFSGYAWSENHGWIKFDCSIVNACVITDWRPLSVRPRSSSGSSGYIINTVKNITPEVVPLNPPFVAPTPIVYDNKGEVEKVINGTKINGTKSSSTIQKGNSGTFINPEPKSPLNITKVNKNVPIYKKDKSIKLVLSRVNKYYVDKVESVGYFINNTLVIGYSFFTKLLIYFSHLNIRR